MQSSNPPFLFASASFGSFIRGYDAFSGFAVASQKGPDTALTALTIELERAQKFGFTDAELERAKKQMVAGLEKAYNDRDKTESGNYVQEYINHFLQQEPTPGIAWEFEKTKAMLPEIKLAEVNGVAGPLKQQPNIFCEPAGSC